jgi:HR-like lesion-inducing
LFIVGPILVVCLQIYYVYALAAAIFLETVGALLFILDFSLGAWFLVGFPNHDVFQLRAPASCFLCVRKSSRSPSSSTPIFAPLASSADAWIYGKLMPLCALAMQLIFTVSVTPVMHNFWDLKEGSEAQLTDMIMFFKNIALVGALLFYLGGKSKSRLRKA